MIPDLTPAEIARFYSKVHLGGCGLVWAGGDVNNHGYGRFHIYRDKGKKCIRILAHRLAYKLATGEDPGTQVVRHGCDSPPCCTPDCFTLGTQADNVRDAVERGRMDVSGLSAHRAARDARAAERLSSGKKRCSRCRVFKTLGDFHRNRQNVDGRQYECKTCMGDRQREYRRLKRVA